MAIPINFIIDSWLFAKIEIEFGKSDAAGVVNYSGICDRSKIEKILAVLQ